MRLLNLLKLKKNIRLKSKTEPPLFPRLQATSIALINLSRKVWEPSNKAYYERIRMLEAKVEYLLDEVYRIKAIQRQTSSAVDILSSMRDYQVETFDYQWGDIVYHDEFLSNPEWKKLAPLDAAKRADMTTDWFKGKKVLDCGCGPGRHTWALSSLGARVTGFDMADKALTAAREALKDFPETVIDKHSILDPLPYTKDYDLVWCYGVLHHTGNTLAGLQNIAQHVRQGGYLYIMLYAEPRRNNIYDYQYQHELSSLREATREYSFSEKEKIFDLIDGKSQTLAWFDAISSEINDLYSFEEIKHHLSNFGFKHVKRTMPNETMLNIVAQKA